MDSSKQLRNTQQRQLILQELRALTTHPTATELYEIARQRLPRISLGTVYRNLELLSQIGMIRKLEFGGAEARFDGNPDDHYHVRCLQCGRLDDVLDLTSDPVDAPSGNLNGYEIRGHRLEFIGICPECQLHQVKPSLK